MTIQITVGGVAYPHPSSAADQNWAAQQIAVLQALAAASGAGPTVKRLYANATAVGNGADFTEDTLMSYSVPALTLGINKGLRVIGWGIGINTPDATTVRAYMGGNVVTHKVLTPGQANDWRIQIDVLCTTLLLATATTQYMQGGTVGASSVEGATGAPLDVSAPQLFKFTGQRGGALVANSVVQYGMSVELIP